MGRFLVIGAYGGIGQKLCSRLVSQGHQLLLCGRDAAKAKSLAADLGHFGFDFDASRVDHFESLLPQILDEFGPIDGVVNLAGSILLKSIERTSLDELHDVMRANFETAFMTVKYLAPYLARQNGGSIVLMSSVAARFGMPNHEAIAAAKGAVQGLMLSAAASYASRGVRINAVAPALVETPMSQKIVSSPEAKQASAAMHPVGRIGQPDDVASMIAWLLEPSQSWVTGQIFGVDGGMSTLKSKR